MGARAGRVRQLSEDRHAALVSVIIPCKNGAAWVAEAIESCLRQSWRQVEIIVVDNASADASLEVAARYRGSSLTILQCDRPGAGAARNCGLQQARGDFIQFLDADDILDEDKIGIQLERLRAAPRSSVASCAWARFRRLPDEAVFMSEPVWTDLPPEEFLIRSWLGGGMMPNFAWLVPRAVIDAAGPWDERLSLNDDGEFFCRVLLASASVWFCGGARGYYRSTAAPTLSKRRSRDALASAFMAIELGCDSLLARCRSPSAMQACATHYQRFAYDAYPEAPDLVELAEQRAARLGGSDLRASGGRRFQMLAQWVGWKAAKRCQSVLRPFDRRVATAD